MSAPSVAIKTLLVNAGLATFAATTGWALYIGSEPQAPDTCITLFDYGGSDPNPTLILDEPNVQVRIRGAIGGYIAAYAKAVAIKKLLLGKAAGAVGSDTINGIWMKGDINPIGNDKAGRPLITINLRISFTPAESGSNRT